MFTPNDSGPNDLKIFKEHISQEPGSTMHTNGVFELSFTTHHD